MTASPQTVLVMTAQQEIAAAARAALAAAGQFAANGPCTSMTELASALRRKPTRIALVDLDPDPIRTLEELETIVVRFPHTRFVTLCERPHEELMLAAMHAGARHLLAKSAMPSELTGILERLAPGGESAEAEMGAVVTVLSAGGGCGATTVAINLAHELSRLGSQPSLLVDMDVGYGAAAAYLGLHGQYGLSDVLSHSGRIDPQLIRSTALNYSDSLRVLISPAGASFARPAPPAFENIDRMLSACQRFARFTVIDAPRVPVDVAAVLAVQSVLTLVLFQLNVKDVRLARSVLGALAERGVPPDRLLPTVSRFQKRKTMISYDDARRALGSATLACLQNDFRSAIRAVNYGQTLAQAAPRSPLHRDIQQLAGQIFNSPACQGRPVEW